MAGPHPHELPSQARIPILLAAAALAVALLLTLFAWPASRQAPRDLPLGVAGPPAAARTLEARLAAQPGAFAVHRYADAAVARRAIEERDVYGALVAEPTGVTLLTASAASPAVAQLLQQAAGPTARRQIDVVPAPADDPRGAGLSASVLPLLVVGIALGLASTMLVRRAPARAGAVVAAAAVTGLTAVAIAQAWLGILDGGWLANAGAIGSLVLAVAALEAGLATLLGLQAGSALTALVVVLIGNPWSAISSAPELLPQPIGAIGQLLPPGAGGTLVRGTAFFDGHGTTVALLVLLAWTAVGLVALAVGARRSRGGARPDTGQPAVAVAPGGP